jgi:hypothetical protein
MSQSTLDSVADAAHESGEAPVGRAGMVSQCAGRPPSFRKRMGNPGRHRDEADPIGETVITSDSRPTSKVNSPPIT